MTTAIMDKRDRDEAESSSLIDYKRQRLVDVDGSLRHKVGATELASAFALASLASMRTSPTTSTTPEPKEQIFAESRDAEHAEESEAPPFTPDDVRSPVRQSDKHVTFSSDTKITSRETSRKLSLPPRINKSQQQSRVPPVFGAPGHFAHNHSHQHFQPHWMSPQRMMVPHGSTFMPPPPIRVQAPPSDKWICDFCNTAAFDSYQEACVHEESCRVHCQRRPSWPPAPQLGSQHLPVLSQQGQGPGTFHPDQTMYTPAVIHSQSRPWYGGTKSLAIPGSDSDWLSGLNCFIREKCVEAFSATEEDVTKTSKRGRISLHQVGIRCRFCSHCPKEEAKMAAVSYPLSVAGIYESVKRWQKVHLEVCEDVPREAKAKLQELSANNSWVPTTRQYWADSAKSLGMVDTEDGIRFATDPRTGTEPDVEMSSDASREPAQEHSMFQGQGKQGSSLNEGGTIVYQEDIALVPPYVYFLMRQVEYTRFTEADRFVARSKGPVGYSGFQCRHCHGHAGLGKYFPVSSKSLSTNSTSQNIHSHLLKCRKVSPYVKEQLVALKEEKSKAPRLEPGWRRVFFEKIWTRLHG